MKQETEPFVILPRGQQLGLYRWDGSSARELGVIGAPAWATCCLGPNKRYAAALTKEGRKVRAWELEQDAVGETVFDSMMPDGSPAHAVQIVDDQLYLGSKHGDEGMLWRCELTEPEPSLQKVQVPEELHSKSKAVDAFELRDGRLLAVDNLVLPKYFLLYDVTDPAAPELKRTVDMPAHGTYESVFSLAANSKCIAIASNCVGRGGQSRHISIIGPENLQEMSVLSYSSSGSSTTLPQGLALTEDRLYLAGGEAGIATYDLDVASGEPSDPAIDVSKTPSDLVSLNSDHEVTDVRTVPGIEGCFAFLKIDKLNFEWEWVEG